MGQAAPVVSRFTSLLVFPSKSQPLPSKLAGRKAAASCRSPKPRTHVSRKGFQFDIPEFDPIALCFHAEITLGDLGHPELAS